MLRPAGETRDQFLAALLLDVQTQGTDIEADEDFSIDCSYLEGIVKELIELRTAKTEFEAKQQAVLSSKPSQTPSQTIEEIQFIDEDKAMEVLNMAIEAIQTGMLNDECSVAFGDVMFDTEWPEDTSPGNRRGTPEGDLVLEFVYKKQGEGYCEHQFPSLEKAIIHAIQSGKL